MKIEIDNQVIEFDVNDLVVEMKKRIWELLRTEKGVKVPTDLIDTGLLINRYDIVDNTIRVQFYYEFLEDRYGQIFALNEKEFEILEDIIIQAIDEKWSFQK